MVLAIFASLSYMDFSIIRNHSAVKKIVSTLPKHAQVFVVGGAVRDVLLKRPIGDLDLVVRHVPLKTMREWLEHLGTIDDRGQAWGVLQVTIDGEKIDVALPRADTQRRGDGSYTDTRATPDPELIIEEDLRRRDFTINALALDLKSGELIDPFHGNIDCKEKILRTVGNPATRFAEDHSRILRCLRLATQLDFKFEPLTWQALKTTVQTKSPLNIPARIWKQEQNKVEYSLATYHEWLRKAGIETHHHAGT